MPRTAHIDAYRDVIADGSKRIDPVINSFADDSTVRDNLQGSNPEACLVDCTRRSRAIGIPPGRIETNGWVLDVVRGSFRNDDA